MPTSSDETLPLDPGIVALHNARINAPRHRPRRSTGPCRANAARGTRCAAHSVPHARRASPSRTSRSPGRAGVGLGSTDPPAAPRSRACCISTAAAGCWAASRRMTTCAPRSQPAPTSRCGRRLPPGAGNPHPAQFEDNLAARAWVLEHGAAHGIDAGRLIAAGDTRRRPDECRARRLSARSRPAAAHRPGVDLSGARPRCRDTLLPPQRVGEVALQGRDGALSRSLPRTARLAGLERSLCAAAAGDGRLRPAAGLHHRGSA